VLGAPHLDFEMWETTNSKELLHPVRDLENFSFRDRVRVSHPRRVFVFAARVGFLYTIRKNALNMLKI
jgi:hypothetical protein